MNNMLGQRIELFWTMRKLNTPLSISSKHHAFAIGKKLFDYPRAMTTDWYDNGDIYFDKSEVDIIKQFLTYKISIDCDYPDKISKNIFALAQKIKKQQITKDLSHQSLSNLKKIFTSDAENYFLKMMGYMSYRGTVQLADILEEKLDAIITYKLAQKNKLSQKKVILNKLTISKYLSIVSEERNFILTKIIEKNNIQRSINEYHKNFDWLGFHWLVGQKPIDNEIKKKLLLNWIKAKKELSDQKKQNQLSKKEITHIIKWLNFNSLEKKILNQLQTWIYLRTYIKDCINLAGYKLLPILDKIGEKLAISGSDLPYLYFDELLNSNSKNSRKLARLIAQRRKGFSAGSIGGKFIVGRCPVAREEVSQNLQNVIKGNVAYKGKIQGIARIIKSPNECKRLKKGEILVTSMTTPDFLPAMEKALAFVTDEGGITCHAAIVAREMKKPCVIGTKIATKILHDGDKIEVDANSGLVRKI